MICSEPAGDQLGVGHPLGLPNIPYLVRSRLLEAVVAIPPASCTAIIRQLLESSDCYRGDSRWWWVSILTTDGWAHHLKTIC